MPPELAGPGSDIELGRARQLALIGVKSIHSAIFAVIATSILYLFVAGLTGRGTRWTGPAARLALAECAVIVLNRGDCPLTNVAEAIGAEDGRVSSIFLPQWLADRVPYLFTPPLAVGLVALAWRRRRSGSATTPATNGSTPAFSRDASATGHVVALKT